MIGRNPGADTLELLNVFRHACSLLRTDVGVGHGLYYSLYNSHKGARAR